MSYFLPAQELLCDKFVEEIAAVGIPDGDLGLPDENGIVVEGVDLFDVDYERLRYSCKNIPRQLIVNGLDIHGRHYLLLICVKDDIVLEAFHKKDVPEPDLEEFPVSFYKEIVFGSFFDPAVGDRGLQQLAVGQHFGHGFLEAFGFYRFDQVIGGIYFVAVQREFGIGGGEDHQCFWRDRPGEIDAIDTRHADVEEDEIDGILFQEFSSGIGIAKAVEQYQLLCFVH